MISLPNFPHRVRIHGGGFDASARAMHREAAIEMVSIATIERIQMSTKTTLKRVALVAVAAMGFGLLSVAPSSAANTVLVYTSGDGAAATPFNTGAGVAGVANSVTLTATQNATKKELVTISGASATITSGNGGTAIGTDKLNMTFSAGSTPNAIVIATPAVGTITASLFLETAAGSGLYSTTATETVTITVNASAQSGGVSVAKTVSYLVAGDSSTTGSAGFADVIAAADATAIGSATASNTAVGTIKIKVLDLLGAALNDSLTATITSGPGSVNNVTGTAGTAQSVTSAAGDTSGYHNFYVYPTGVAGTTTVAIKDGSTVLATKTVTFSGVATTYVATIVTANNIVGTNTGSVTVKATDSAGNKVADSSTVYAFDGTAATGTISTSKTTTAGVATFDFTGVAVGSSVVTFGNASTLATSTVTTTVTLNVVKATAATVVFSFDKDSYAPGEKIVLKVTAKDANGAAIADGARAVFATGGITASQSLSGGDSASLTTTNPTFAAGIKTYTLYAPLGGGTITFTATEGTATDSTTKATITGSINVVVDTSATDAATDAANAATDAANYAADAADAATTAAEEATAAANDAADAAKLAQDSADAATAAVVDLGLKVTGLIASLRAQLTALTNLIVKIQAKVNTLPKK